MTIKRWRLAVLAGGCAFFAGLIPGAAGTLATARAQVSEEPEQGATHPTQVEMRAGRDRRDRVHVHATTVDHDRDRVRDGDDDGIRVGVQARLDALNSLDFSAPDVADVNEATLAGRHLLVPLITPGVRLLDGTLFLGLGLGLAGASLDTGAMSTSRSGFSLTPMGHYDLLVQGPVSLSLGGWLNFAHLGETENCNAADVCGTANDDVTGWGLSLAGGLHAWLMPGLSLGSEFGWGFLSLSNDAGTDLFVHGLFGTIQLEVSIGI